MSNMFVLKLFCFFGLVVTTQCTTVQCGVNVCRPLWTKFQDHCYRFFGEPKSWQDAESFCHQFATRANTGHLVSIHNEDENGFVHEMWQSSVVAGLDPSAFESGPNRANSVWIGMEDRETEGSFEWSDGTDTAFTKWHSGNPSNSGSVEDCVHMYREDAINVDKWNDVSCSSRLFPFICEMHMD